MRRFHATLKVEDTTLGWRFVNPAMKALTARIPCRRQRRTSPKSTASRARTRILFALRSQQRAADARCATRPAGGRDCSSGDYTEKGRAAGGFNATSIRAVTQRSEGLAGKLEADRKARRNRDRGERFRHQRWSGCSAYRVTRAAKELRVEAARSRARYSHRGSCAAYHGDGTGPGNGEGTGHDRPHYRADGCNRVERSFCGPGARGAAVSWRGRRRRRMSIRTAAPSPWVILWEPAAPGW